MRMKKKAYKTPKGGSFRTYFHGDSKTNGCSFHRIVKPGKGDRGNGKG